MSRYIFALLAGVFIACYCAGSACAEDRKQTDTDGTNFFITADYIYQKLQAGEAGILTPDWGSGFRVSAGYRLPGSAWDIKGGYTYYRASSDDKVTGTTTHVELYPPETYRTIYRAFSKYYLDEAVAEAGYRLQVTDDLYLRLHLGPQYTRIEEQITNHATNFYYSPGHIYNQYTFYMVYQGYGVRAGVDCNYALGRGFMLTGGISGGYIFGTLEEYTSTINPGWEYDSDIPFYAADLGLGYGIRLSDTANLNISIGYEIAEYLDLYQQTISREDVDYMLHGPYFRARLDF